jgi:hypothetical protein
LTGRRIVVNRILTSVTLFFLSVLTLVLATCTPNQQQVQENKPATQATQPLEIKLPPKFGVFYESAQGPMELGEKTTLPAANPSFILYLEKVPEAAKLRLRFVKASGGPFIVDAGTVTSSDSDKPKTPPKPGNYQNVFVLAYGEGAGVFEPQVTAVEGQRELYKAVYSGALKPGEYFAFYFIDESKGPKPWEEARFKFAGQFKVE